ncbi:MAG: S41 family peptidase [Crocinitomicaceae bacterium]|nr:S41 family peptidase [Crocinitomicaceae bacterium]
MERINKIISRPKRWLGYGIIAVVVLTSAKITDDFFEVSKNMEIFTSMYKELNMYYVDETKPGQLMKTGIDAMLKSLDPYTVYYPESKIEDAMFMQTGQYGGIGALVNTVNKRVTITEPYQGFAAAKSGLRAGDVLLKINGKSVEGKTQEEVTDQLTGQPGTTVSLLIERKGNPQPLNITIEREEIKIPDVPYYRILDDGKTGFIKLTGFTQRASTDVQSAFNTLKKQNMERCILDLRGNGGGLLREAINIVNFFVPKGTEIVRTKGKLEEWNKTYTALNDPIDTKIPLVVLIDGESASASEIVSGSLQDLDRAVVVGEESYGKCLVQQTKDLAYNTKMKLTVAKYYTPSGRCIQRLDYAHRNTESGKVDAVADSAIKEFKTKNGRPVFDGRGIRPDVEVKLDETSNVLVGLVSNWILFDYATDYRNNHEHIDSADVFHLSDKEYADFVAYAKGEDFHYETDTEKLFEKLKEAAKEEKCFDGNEKQFDDLFARIEPHKESDLKKFRKEISDFLENEIVSRYYYQDGRIKNALPGDQDVQKALEVLNADYSTYLQGNGGAKK